jgi:hypothetical protein
MAKEIFGEKLNSGPRLCYSGSNLNTNDMEHQIKALVEAIGHDKLKKLVQSHVKELLLENKHLIIFVENTAPLHELNHPSMEEHMKKALEKVYGTKITYEFRLHHLAHEKSEHMSKNQSRRTSH